MLLNKLVSMIVLAMIILGVTMLFLLSHPVRATTIKGDLDGDGKVDGTDLALVAKAFGSYPGSARWDSKADLNGDGLVNSLDLAVVAEQFGKTT